MVLHGHRCVRLLAGAALGLQLLIASGLAMAAPAAPCAASPAHPIHGSHCAQLRQQYLGAAKLNRELAAEHRTLAAKLP